MARGRGAEPEPTISAALRRLNIRHLEESFIAIPKLKQLRDSRSTEFRAWQDRTLQSLGVVFTKTHDYYTRFRRLDFYAPRMRIGGAGQPWAQMDVDAFDRDIVLAATLLEDAMEEADALQEGDESTVQTTPRTIGKDVFIVHGHDETNLYRLRDLIQDRFKLHPVILKWKAGIGRAMIEKFEQEADQCGYAFALLTPDDQIEVPGGEYTQARPNVVFELGWFYGRLDRSRVAILLKNGTNLHSDLAGISRIDFTDSVEEKVLEIERELQAAGLISTPGS